MASLEVLLQQLTNTLKSVIGAGIENETINLYEYNINEYSLLLKVAYIGWNENCKLNLIRNTYYCSYNRTIICSPTRL